MYFPFWSPMLCRQTSRTRLMTTSWRMSTQLGSWSSCERRYWTARSGAVLQSIIRALRRAETSCSVPRKRSIISAASGRRFSPAMAYMALTALTALRRTKECLCSRFERIEGIRGSRISTSLMRHRKRRVTPRRYSFGCCRLFRRFWQIKIISGRSFPDASVFRSCSRYKSRSFWIEWSSLGRTYLTMVMKSWLMFSPFSMR
mmetsp:Transcript_4169/g.10731  ORF Transcript_4169/g.10731 Transcript_4169/m.10731 type:complete len:202 (+) Transcript_4169:393-998(+)